MPIPIVPAGADLNALPVFAAVAEQGGFTAAAEQLGLAKARVSLVIARLEAQLGHTLFARTTRRVALTAAGRALYEQCVPHLRAAEEALGALGDTHVLSGPLRIAAPLEYAVQVAARAVAAFAADHPRLEIDLRTSDRIVDLLQEGVDVALRLGWLRDSTLRAVKLAEFEQWIVASPKYLRSAPRISRPEDLAACDWVALEQLQAPLTWKFSGARGRTRTVRMNTKLRTDSVGALRAMLEAGAGVSALDEFTAAPALQSGALVRLLPQWQLRRGGVHAVFPPGRFVPAKARAFAEFYRQWLASR